MNYQLFIRALHQELLNALCPDIIPQLRRYPGNNNDAQDFITFIPASGSSMTGLYPAISLKTCFEQYEQGKALSVIVSDILQVLEHAKTAPEICPEQFTDFEQIKDKICLKLVSQKENKRLLQEIPFISYYDLALVCIYFHPDAAPDVTATFLIQKQHLTLWNIDAHTLFEHAVCNSPRMMHPVIRPIYKVLKELASLPDGCPQFRNFYVLTNEYRYLGAVCMTFPDVLAQFAKKMQSNLFLIPASIHEILIFPDNGRVPEDLNDIIISINIKSVKPQDRLSDHFYYYDRSKNLIRY